MAFNLNEDGARQWLAGQIALYGEYGDPRTDPGPEELTSAISPTWDPRRPYELTSAVNLVADAIRYGYLTGSGGTTTIALEPVAAAPEDGIDAGYRWIADVRSPAPLTLASDFAEACQLGDLGIDRVGTVDAPPGLDNALDILREARQQGNALLGQLHTYVGAIVAITAAEEHPTDGTGVSVSTYTGPARSDGGDRKRVQIARGLPGSGHGAVITFSKEEWMLLAMDLRESGLLEVWTTP